MCVGMGWEHSYVCVGMGWECSDVGVHVCACICRWEGGKCAYIRLSS